MLLPSHLALPLAALLAPLADALPSRSPSAAQLVQRAPSPEPAGGPSALLRDQLDWSRRQESAPAGGYSLDTSSCGGYNLTSVSQTASGLKAELSMIGEACNAFGIDYERLVLEVDYQSKDRLRVHIYDADRAEYIIPEEVFETPGVDDGFDMTTSDLVFNHDPSPFAFWITRANSDAAPIFDTRPASKQAVPDPIPSPGYGGVIKENSSTAVLNEAGALIFEAGYLEISSALPVGANIVGLSEVVSSSGLWRNSSATVQALWARDAGNPTDQNEYGSFPMYLESRVDGNSTSSHGVFVSSSQGQDILLRDGVIEYRMLGGSLDFYFVSGPTPLAVHEQMAFVIGRPAMPPYWSLGFHLSRWGYDNITQCREMVSKMRAANVPLEVAWNDIDYMDSYRNWIPAPNRYDPDEFKAYVDELHANHQHYIPIVDAAVAVLNPNGSDVYDPYTRGAELDVFMKNPDGSEYRGQVWPGVTVFPDFFSENAEDWWIEANLNFTKLVDLDGIWLDMNEPSSFCDGSCGSGRTDLENITTPFLLPGLPGNVVILDAPYPEGYNATLWGTSGNVTINGTLTFNSTPPASVDRRAQLSRRVGAGVDVNTPAYEIHAALPRLSSSTVSPNATHAGGKILHLDVHNYYGTMMGRATIKALEAHRPGKRPFVVARSLAPGSGRTLAHWTGDNFSRWSSMKDSVRNVLQFSLFGVPMTGADICGFQGNTNEELCSRWMQLGAFHPFYRGHTIRSARPQEPYQWDSVAEASRKAISIRYALLPYWSKLLWYAHTAGTPLIRAPFYEFPDEASLIGVDEQFFVGPDLLVTPVLQPNVTEVEGVLPGGDAVIWRDWYDHSVLTPSADGKYTFPAPLGHIPLSLRSSSMLLLHAKPSYTIYETRREPFELLVSLAADGSAAGTAYVDDGESVDSAHKLLFLSATAGHAVSSSTPEGEYTIDQPLAQVTVLGVGQAPERVVFGGQETTDFTYEQATQKLVVKGLEGDLNSAWELTF